MEKQLSKYRKTLKMQNLFYLVLVLAVMIPIVLSLMEYITPAAGDSHWASAWNGFIGGISAAVVGICVLGLSINLRALKREDKLKKLYIQAHDERAQAIAYRSGHASYWFDAGGLILGTVVGGYFHPVVAVTCLCCLLYICLVRVGLKLYYCRKL